MPKDQPLVVEVVDDELRIRIGVSVLKMAAEEMDSNNPWVGDFDEDGGRFVRQFTVIDPVEWAKDVRHALLDEAENGDTPLTIFLDEIFLATAENGSLATDDDGTPSPVQ